MDGDNPYNRAEGFLPPADDLGLDGYEVAEVLGEGGFGRVYKGRQEAFDRDVAIKVLAASGFREETARRFERECRAIGALSGHPNIVTIYDSGISRLGRPFIVMDHMSQRSLGDRLQGDGPLSWEQAVDVIIKISGAVETAHRNGILHRDIKPENILFSAFGEPKLADFGVASIPGGYRTHTGAITASLAHAAPEVLEGHKATRAVDVYALGSTLFALVAGRTPFESDDGAGLQSLIAKTLTQPVPDLRAEGIPDEVCSTIEKAMAKDPSQRYASAHQLGAALQAAQQAADVPVTPIPVPDAGTDLVTYAIDMPTSSEGARTSIRERRELTPPLAPPPRRRIVWRSPVTAGLLALVLLASGTGVIALRGHIPDSSAPAGTPRGSTQTRDVAAEVPQEAADEPRSETKSKGEKPRKRSRREGGSSFGGSQAFSGGGSDETYSGGSPYQSPPPPSSGSSGGGTTGGGGGGSGGGGASQPEPAPPPNEQPATRAFYHYWADDGRYFFTANDTLANEERSNYDSHRVIAAVWASGGNGLIPLCPDPNRCEAFVSANPPKKGAYKTLYFYTGEHGRFWTTDRSSVPSGSHAYLVGYAR